MIKISGMYLPDHMASLISQRFILTIGYPAKDQHSLSAECLPWKEEENPVTLQRYRNRAITLVSEKKEYHSADMRSGPDHSVFDLQFWEVFAYCWGDC